ncbi:hypothetical protein TrLO_g8883 [Triparma laevis f. longispina]|uniref:Uncharacterized protein n=1 Tax=Triparma laevis f. longispina TaxID=1714387 RepID=A0A9W7CEA6_9STRA|nr:hypothetical protein TrLO_g8883 [Triparma laevis f. longispina]
MDHIRTSPTCIPSTDSGIADLLVPTDVKKWKGKWAVIYCYDFQKLERVLDGMKEEEKGGEEEGSVGDTVAKIIHDMIIEECINKINNPKGLQAESTEPQEKLLLNLPPSSKMMRTYSSTFRNSPLVNQDPFGYVCGEMLSLRVPLPKKEIQSISDYTTETLILNTVNERLQTKFKGAIYIVTTPEVNMPSKFIPESDCSNRRIEYVVPIKCLVEKGVDFESLAKGIERSMEFSVTNKLRREKEKEYESGGGATSTTTADIEDAYSDIFVKNGGDEVGGGAEPGVLEWFHKMKSTMQLFITKQKVVERKIVEGDNDDKPKPKSKEEKATEMEFEEGKKRKEWGEKKRKKKIKKNNGEAGEGGVTEKIRYLHRKKFHNFTSTGLPQDFLISRRLDRFHHKGTFSHLQHPFITVALNGDVFLNGMVPRILSVFLGIQLGMLPESCCEFLMDEEYPRLVTDVPSVPGFALVAGDNSYTTIEGRMKKCLRPRNAGDCFFKGVWSEKKVLDQLQRYKHNCFSEIASKWLEEGVDEATGIPVKAYRWVEDVLKPWCETMLPRIDLYHQWLANGKTWLFLEKDLLQMVPHLDKTVPFLYISCLSALRSINSTGTWPGTTIGRRVVIFDEKKTFKQLLSEKDKIKTNKEKNTSKREELATGEGEGSSGSFSIGYMPSGGGSQQPASNAAFPELVKTAFALERALLPDRPPSSTIAVNRNAQFRPHTDSGAGAGQSLSLIVALGDYVGGELMVEGETENIRYRPVEFDGWKERHYTIPFKGERFSLVWFTPKGCEGMKGIEL